MPLGLFGTPDDQPGVNSVELPSNTITRTLRDVTKFLERLDDLVPGLSTSFFQNFT